MGYLRGHKNIFRLTSSDHNIFLLILPSFQLYPRVGFSVLFLAPGLGVELELSWTVSHRETKGTLLEGDLRRPVPLGEL